MIGDTNDISVQFGDIVQNNLFKPKNSAHGTDLLSINIAVSFDSYCSKHFELSNKPILIQNKNFRGVAIMVSEATRLCGNFVWNIQSTKSFTTATNQKCEK